MREIKVILNSKSEVQNEIINTFQNYWQVCWIVSGIPDCRNCFWTVMDIIFDACIDSWKADPD